MNDQDKLRRQAEEKIIQSPISEEARSPEASRQSLHELRVHQVELELQNVELRRIQESLNAERARYFDLYELAPVGYISIYENGLIQNANLAAARLLGVARGQLVNHPFFHFIQKEEQDVYYRHHKQLVTTAAQQDYELRMMKQDGTVFWSQLLVSLAQESDGAKLCQIVLTDITARKQAEDALRDRELHMRVITDSAQDAILTMDQKGNISYWNPSAGRIFGYTSDEAIGRNLHQLLAPQRHRQMHIAAFPEFQQTGLGPAIGKTLDLDARRKDGKEIAVQLSISAMSINGVWHAVGIVRDITERKRAEAALLKSSQQLEEATAKAEEANIAKSEFLANMSHEIRTPMNGVVGMTWLLMDTPLSEEQRKYAETIHSSGQALLTIINDILDFSKIEAGKIELEELNFNLRELIDETIAVMTPQVATNGLDLVCAVEPGVPHKLCGDSGRLRQILLNLLGNAIKFTHQGEIAVHAGLVSETDSGAVIRFSVRDTGVGIAEEKRASIFNKFTQADSSTTRKYGGTGLGLTISKKLVELMGGEIGVISPAKAPGISHGGAGSEFWFTVCFTKQNG